MTGIKEVFETSTGIELVMDEEISAILCADGAWYKLKRHTLECDERGNYLSFETVGDPHGMRRVFAWRNIVGWEITNQDDDLYE
ncbi:hypothetical protein PP304_gp165 [Gordonia phage Phendrix]|uniref:Uncharacterized protein n=1 Tax=Gordonia phage Phendrix TaxID=2593335 RepID=A0A514U183_9CAUD|nr:hypothetical protein PP304_gp165 [Gordonia phage Phendrix]QDK02704.1 hypothetical protein SEA_PHENDRIX_188 [Gordonia phage Phendrix]